MEPMAQTTTELGSEAATTRQARLGRDVSMIDSVKVDAGTFDSVIFLGSEERKEFVEGGNIPHNQKKQQVTKEGVPVWTVKLYATTWRGLERQVKVNVPARENPGDRLGKGELVTLSDVEFGVTPKREGGGYIVWLRAGSIEPATGRKSAAVSAA